MTFMIRGQSGSPVTQTSDAVMFMFVTTGSTPQGVIVSGVVSPARADQI